MNMTLLFRFNNRRTQRHIHCKESKFSDKTSNDTRKCKLERETMIKIVSFLLRISRKT